MLVIGSSGVRAREKQVTKLSKGGKMTLEKKLLYLLFSIFTVDVYCQSAQAAPKGEIR
jgi:hypothetical protein